MQKSVKRAKRKIERKLAKNKKKHSKRFFSYIKKRTKNKVTVGPLREEGEMVTDSEKMAEVLNAWYCSVFINENLTDIPEAEKLYTGEDPLSTVHFTAGNVKKKLEKLKPTSAPGPDKIWARVLRDLADALAHPLAIVFTRCMEEGGRTSGLEKGECNANLQVRTKGQPGQLQAGQPNEHRL